MTDKPFLSEYSGQNIDEILGLESRYRIDSLVLVLEDAIWKKRERVGGRALSNEELTVLSVEALEREVNNGGYHQFFFNTAHIPETGLFARRIVRDLQRIGCAETARITEQAIAMLDLADLSPDAVLDRLDEDDDRLTEALDDLDNAYYGAAEDIAGKLFTFVKQNKDSFSIP